MTISFDPEKEKKFIAPALHMYEGQLKAISFLPMSNTTYPQQPYTQITEEEYNKYVGKILKIDFTPIYEGETSFDAEGDRYCSNDVCDLPQITTADVMDTATV